MARDYSSGNPTGTTSATTEPDASGYWDLGKLKRCYTDYLGTKRDEIDEAKNARRYYHGAQWTAEQIKVLKKRKQPVITKNRIGRKIDGVVGLLERLRQDPKAFPRTPQHEEGADLATAVIRYVLDEQEWKTKSSEVARDGAIEGIAGLEINLTGGDQGDKEIELDIVDPDSFIYDPRSFRPDFSDARYMGVGKWVDVELAKEMFPDQAEEIDSSIETGTDLTSNPDREAKWFDSENKHIRLADIWYKHKGGWCYCIFTGSTKLMEGKSYLTDEKGKTECKYIMYSASVDHDGDRYGFVRNLRSSQDEMNMRSSKSLHILNSRRLIMDESAVQDIETARREWARPDGVVIKNAGREIIPEDQTNDFVGQLKLLEEAKNEIENFGPNPALIGQGVENQSGRAISLLQQAGIAELGPYIQAFRGWKIRVYRAVWNAVQHHWTAERWVRVTDDEKVAQFIQINGLGLDPQTGMPTIINALGSLDVDIIIDEGPDSINMAADTYDALIALANNGAQVPPAVLIELSPGIDSRTKKKVMEMIEKASQPGQAQQIALAGEQAKIKETESRAMLNMAKAREAMTPEQPQMGAPGLPMPLQAAESMADIDDTRAATELKQAQTAKIVQDMSLAPQKMAMDAANKAADRDTRIQRSQVPAR